MVRMRNIVENVTLRISILRIVLTVTPTPAHSTGLLAPALLSHLTLAPLMTTPPTAPQLTDVDSTLYNLSHIVYPIPYIAFWEFIFTIINTYGLC